MLRVKVWVGLVVTMALVGRVQAQVDPAKRELIQLGYNQPIEGKGPLAAYAFYYLNLPQFLKTNLTLRLAIAPVYLDSELGIREIISPYTDLGLGVHGGGFADSYSEIRQGNLRESESFTGHGGGFSASLYQLLNPGQRIPLSAVIRTEAHMSIYGPDDDTAEDFELPDDRTNFNLRGGLRLGGREPLIAPEVSMELSAWYEAQIRSDSGAYGFDNDRDVEGLSQLVWGRALIGFGIPKINHSFNVSLTAGTGKDLDRFSGYRLGGFLPMAAEFPLSLPGYYFQEISAERFVLFGGNYTIPLDKEDRFAINFIAATAGVDYVDGLEQPGYWHSGIGGGFRFSSPSKAFQLMLGYAYGIDAIRNDSRGAHNIGVLMQFDLETAGRGLFEPGENPIRSRGLQRLFRLQ